MKPTALLLPLIVTILAMAVGCGEDSTVVPRGSGDESVLDQSSTPADLLQVEFLEGWIQGDLMPPLPADPIRCRITLQLTNMSERRLYGLRVSSADVYLVSTGELLGTLPLETDWDGRLEPLETEVVVVEKEISPNYIFDPVCNEAVYLEIFIRISGRDTVVFTTPVMIFECTY
jgi:hypothetical protein